jgi:predicted Zn-dependent protease
VRAVLRRQNAIRHRKVGMSMAADGSLQFAINELITLFGMGRYAEVEQGARFILERFPRSPTLCELCGMALGAQARFPEALVFLEKAVRADKTDPQFWENLPAPGAAMHIDTRGPCLNFGKPI